MNALDPDIEELLNRIVDGLATEDDELRLAEWLRSGSEARKVYRQFMALHSALHWDYVAAVAPKPAPTPIAPQRLNLFSRATFISAAAIAAVIVLGIIITPDPVKEVQPVNQSLVPIEAQLVNEVGAKFAEEHAPDGDQFGPGVYELLEGMVHLRFANGADVVLASPARLDIQDEQNVRLVYGKVRVTAPPSAKGFTISTRSANYIDLGTEFGLQVDRETGASDLYVFDGQVNIADPRSGETLAEVFDGESTRYTDGELATAPRLVENNFPTTGAIGLQRWRHYEEKMRKDSSLLAFFPFERTDDNAVLTNRINSMGVDNGRIVGARWTTGRWPGKEALLFDRDTDYVQLEIPGTYRELSIAVWLKVDRFDFPLNTILNSDGYDLGDIHFQLTRQGYPRGGVVVEGPLEEEILEYSVSPGEWVHVASVLETKTCTQKIYLDGVLARHRKWDNAEAMRPGSCRLGNWLPVANVGPQNRALRGRIDELAIWNRALPEGEIRSLVAAGQTALENDYGR